MNIKNKNHGFTLIELVIVLILFGFVSSAMMLGLKAYTDEQRIIRTNNAINLSLNAINTFSVANNGRLPCPARLTAAETDADYGYDIIYGATPQTSPTNVLDPANAATVQTRINDVIASNGIGIVTGQADIDGDTNGEQILTGAVPFKTLLNSNSIAINTSIHDELRDIKFGAKHTRDSWGNKIVYSVSRHLCDPTSPLFGDPRGAIDIITSQQCTHSTLGIVPVSILPGEGECKQDNKRYAQFAMFSHGENGRGAYTDTTGNLVENCVNKATIPPTPQLGETSDRGIFDTGRASDIQNCDFMSTPANPNANRGRFFSGLRSEGDNNSYYDDNIQFFYEDSSNIWESANGIPDNNGTPLDPTDDFIISQIRNINPGNIGVGTTMPNEKLHIEGDMQAFDIEAEGFCDNLSPNNRCLGAQELAGQEGVDNNLICRNPGEVVKRIQNGAFECEDPFIGLNFSCGTTLLGVQMFLQQVYSDGRRTCCDTTDPNNPVCTTL